MKFLHSKYFDLIAIINSPLVAWLLVLLCLWGDNSGFWVVALFSGFILKIFFQGYGDMTTISRAIMNKDVRQKFSFRYLLFLIPVAIIMNISAEGFLLLWAIEFLWDYHHTALQSWGIGLLYDYKNNYAKDYLKKIDKIFCYSTHFIFLIYFNYFSLIVEESVSFLKGTFFEPIQVLALSFLSFLENYSDYLMAVYALFIIFFIVVYVRQEVKVWPKLLYFFNIFIFFSSFSLLGKIENPLLSLVILYTTLEIFHAMQAGSLSWIFERKTMAKFNFNPLIIFSFLILIFGIIEYQIDFNIDMKFHSFVDQNVTGESLYALIDSPVGWLLKIRLIFNLFHYYADSFIWAKINLKDHINQ